MEGLAWLFLEGPAVSLGHHHRHQATLLARGLLSFVWLSLGFDFGTAAKYFERNLRLPFTPPLIAVLVLQKVFKLVEDATPGTIRSSIDKVVCKFCWRKVFALKEEMSWSLVS